MKNIVTKFGKFIYNRILVSMFNSGDIFQAKSHDILGDTKGVKRYIHNYSK